MPGGVWKRQANVIGLAEEGKGISTLALCIPLGNCRMFEESLDDAAYMQRGCIVHLQFA